MRSADSLRLGFVVVYLTGDATYTTTLYAQLVIWEIAHILEKYSLS